jgi:hypothetical protein
MPELTVHSIPRLTLSRHRCMPLHRMIPVSLRLRRPRHLLWSLLPRKTSR